MCLICVELIKQRMTWNEGERATLEITQTNPDDEHNTKLRKALKEMDLDLLAEVLNESEVIGD